MFSGMHSTEPQSLAWFGLERQTAPQIRRMGLCVFLRKIMDDALVGSNPVSKTESTTCS